eukprot:jgi/Mesen1/8722/ME000052S08151
MISTMRDRYDNQQVPSCSVSRQPAELSLCEDDLGVVPDCMRDGPTLSLGIDSAHKLRSNATWQGQGPSCPQAAAGVAQSQPLLPPAWLGPGPPPAAAHALQLRPAPSSSPSEEESQPCAVPSTPGGQEDEQGAAAAVAAEGGGAAGGGEAVAAVRSTMMEQQHVFMEQVRELHRVVQAEVEGVEREARALHQSLQDLCHIKSKSSVSRLLPGGAAQSAAEEGAQGSCQQEVADRSAAACGRGGCEVPLWGHHTGGAAPSPLPAPALALASAPAPAPASELGGTKEEPQMQQAAAAAASKRSKQAGYLSPHGVGEGGAQGRHGAPATFKKVQQKQQEGKSYSHTTLSLRGGYSVWPLEKEEAMPSSVPQTSGMQSSDRTWASASSDL